MNQKQKQFFVNSAIRVSTAFAIALALLLVELGQSAVAVAQSSRCDKIELVTKRGQTIEARACLVGGKWILE